MNHLKPRNFLSAAPLLWVVVSMLFPSIPESALITLLLVTTLVCFLFMYEKKEKSLGIGFLSALIVFMIGADRVHDYFRYDHGTLGSMAEAAALLLCSTEYFHCLLRHSDQKKQIEELLDCRKCYENLEKQIIDKHAKSTRTPPSY